MRSLRMFASILVVAATSASAQAPVASPDHPGWTPAGGGCSVWNPRPNPNETVAWSGGCRDGRTDGFGVETWRSGGQVVERYEGEVRDGRLNGRGSMSFKNGNRYEGEWRADKMSGQGVFNWANGDRYEGEWVDGKQSGHGVHVQADGTRYDGAWVNGEPSGHGLLVGADGNRFEGEFAHGKRFGRGIFVRANGDRFEGDWVDDKASGHGVLTKANGDRYDGEWVADKRSGHGIMIWADGSRYDGAWADNKPSGQGVFEANGKRWEGSWSDGRPAGRHPDCVRLVVGQGMTSGVTGADVTEPDWLRRPTAEEVERFWPAESRGVSGRAVISCAVTARGSLDDCAVASEDPSGRGFGGAALLMAPMFMMRPLTKNGVPVGGARVTIPIRFHSGGAAGSEGPTIRVARTLPWGETPTAAAMAAAFPKFAVGRAAYGHLVLRCRLTGKGTLDQCAAASEDPSNHGFAGAALRLSKEFRTLDGWRPAEGSGDLWVDLPFDFRAPGSPAAVEIRDPMWLKTPDPKMAGKLFPADAAEAGYKTGVATVGCKVAHAGSLVDCEVVSESPPGFGFGKVGLAIAAAVVMNPWTAQGAPVDGARVRLPIRINLGGEPGPASASSW